jgi:hypothetical protein
MPIHIAFFIAFFLTGDEVGNQQTRHHITAFAANVAPRCDR